METSSRTPVEVYLDNLHHPLSTRILVEAGNINRHYVVVTVEELAEITQVKGDTIRERAAMIAQNCEEKCDTGRTPALYTWQVVFVEELDSFVARASR